VTSSDGGHSMERVAARSAAELRRGTPDTARGGPTAPRAATVGSPAMVSTWLVTGGAGYIGSHTVRALRARGDEVVALDDLSSGLVERLDGAELVRASVLDTDAVAEALHAHRVTGVMHLAAKKSAPESVAAPLYYWHENVGGLRSLLAAMAATGVDRLVYTSSAAVYGAPEVETVTEDTACVPLNPYGTTKLAGEWMIAEQARATGLAAAALRYFNVAGTAEARLADRGKANLVPIAMDAVAAGRRPPVTGTDFDTPDGSGVRDYVHVEDVADAHAAVTGALTPGLRVYNVGCGRGHSVLEVLAEIGRASGLPIDPEPADRRPGDAARVVADVSRIHGDLRWSARHDLASMVASAWEARAVVTS
jgi:UDP-glucose 4-epimerase